jgi:phosphoribosylformimino-5-aminoimidazole carboxamide ribotide isomerase
MRFLPVLDVQNGIVVRALAGRRAEYRPLVSKLTKSTDPLVVAEAIRGRFGWHEIYLADLDSIAVGGVAANFGLYNRLRRAGFQVWLDAGIETAHDADRFANAGIERIVVGLETLRSPGEWRAIVERLGHDRVVFSLDLRAGEPIASTEIWGTNDSLAIAERVIADGCRQMIVLDLARVGVGAGPGTENLCEMLTRQHPGLAVYVGGGVRGWDDVGRLQTLGAAGVLLASALHDGAWTPL